MTSMKKVGLQKRINRDNSLQLATYFSRLLDRFEALDSYRTDFIVLAGRIITMRTPSDTLRDIFLPALSHLLVDDPGLAAEFTIWYAEDVNLSHKLVAPPWSGFNGQGFNTDLDQEDIQIFFQPWQRQVFLYSRSMRVGIYWVQTVDDVPWWESTFSFRTIFHFWTRDLPAQLVHAGAIAKNGEGILITGPSGSGKSTSCLSLLRAGYQYLGDDYVWVELGDNPAIHALYQTAKVETDNLIKRFADWIPHVSNKASLEQQKAIFHIKELLPKAFIPSARLRAVLLPQVANREKSIVEAIKPTSSLLAMAPTTLHHLPHHRHVSYGKLKEISVAVPNFRWYLGSDTVQLEKSFDQLYAADELS